MSAQIWPGPIKTVAIRVRSFEEYAAHSRKRAKAMDAGEPVEPERGINFETAADLFENITAERIELCMAVRKEPCTLDELAQKLARSKRSVVRDVKRLRELGLVRAWKRCNPGHGQVTVVKAAAERLVFEL